MSQQEEHMTRAEFGWYAGGVKGRFEAIEKRLDSIEGRAWQVWLAIGSAVLAVVAAALKAGVKP